MKRSRLLRDISWLWTCGFRNCYRTQLWGDAFLRSWVRRAKEPADGVAAASPEDSKHLPCWCQPRCSEVRASLGARTGRGNAPQDPTGQAEAHMSTHRALALTSLSTHSSCRDTLPPHPPPTHTHTHAAVPLQGMFPQETVELLHQDGTRETSWLSKNRGP